MNGWRALLPGPAGIRKPAVGRLISETSSIQRDSADFLLPRDCSAPGHRMKPFHLHSIAFLFTSVMAIGALAPAAVAEQPAVSPHPPAESKKTPAPVREKPQVIYHVSKADVAALHAQAKSQSDALPVDGNMPTSLQMSRAAANDAAVKAAAPQQPSASPNAPVVTPGPAKNGPTHSRIRAKESPHSKNFSPRVQGKEPQKNSHGPKSHKK
jgi:hypothetical protein